MNKLVVPFTPGALIVSTQFQTVGDGVITGTYRSGDCEERTFDTVFIDAGELYAFVSAIAFSEHVNIVLLSCRDDKLVADSFGVRGTMGIADYWESVK